MSSLLAELDPLYTDICNLLGELAGNEAYWDVLEAACKSGVNHNDDQPKGSRLWSDFFDVPGTYGFKVEHQYWIDGHEGDKPATTPPITTHAALSSQAESAYHTAVGNYAGYEAELRSWGQNVWEPEPFSMSGNVDSLVSFAQWLHDQLKPGAGYEKPDDPIAPAWLSNLQKYWPATSASSDSFYDFWDDVNDKCALYLDAAQRLAATSGQVTGVVHDFQRNLVNCTKTARDHVKLALEQWQTWKGPSGTWPTGKIDEPSGTVHKILSGTALATGFIALFPPAAVVAGGISVAAGSADYILDRETEEMAAMKAAQAMEIWFGYLADVETICRKMKEALDGLHTKPQKGSLASGNQGFESYVGMVKADRRDWEPPDVRI